jgi:hypothetical protein
MKEKLDARELTTAIFMIKEFRYILKKNYLLQQEVPAQEILYTGSKK